MKNYLHKLKIKNLTQARVNLTTSGHSLATQNLLQIKYARVKAAQMIYTEWECDVLQQALRGMNEKVKRLASFISNRTDYLQRPDLGRKLNEESRFILESGKTGYDLVCIVSDGLSAPAIENHFLNLWCILQAKLSRLKLRIAPLILIPNSRVAISDDVGFYLKAKLSLIFIGERPGSTTTDSLGIYLTYNPKPGNTDFARNCISNICPPHGLSYEAAAERVIFLIKTSLERKLSGQNILLQE